MENSKLFHLHIKNCLKTAKKEIGKVLKALSIHEDSSDIVSELELLERCGFVNINHIYNSYPYTLSNQPVEEGNSNSNLLPPYLQERYNSILSSLTGEITPPSDLILKGVNETLQALSDCNLKCIVIGQDPYPTLGKATGRAFEIPLSTSDNVSPYYSNTSIQFIYDQLECEGYSLPPMNERGNFDIFVENGVMWLNTILTTEVGKIKAHKSKKIGWKDWMIDFIIHILEEMCHVDRNPTHRSRGENSLVFLTWGNDANKFVKSVFKKIQKKSKSTVSISSTSDKVNVSVTPHEPETPFEDKPKYTVQTVEMFPLDEDRTGSDVQATLGHRGSLYKPYIVSVVGNCHPSPINRGLMKQNWVGSGMFKKCEELCGRGLRE